MRKIFKLFLIPVVFIFVGCAEKSFTITKEMKEGKDIAVYKKLPAKISDFNENYITLEDGSFISKDGFLDKKIVGATIIDKNIYKNGNILIVGDKNITFSKMIVTATKKDDLVALIFVDNSFELYSLKDNKSLIETKFDKVYGVDNHIARPLFYDDLLIVPTLNGKLSVYDVNKLKYLTDIPVSSKDFFSNVIYLTVKGDYLIAVSKDRIISRGKNFIQKYSDNIKNVLVDDKNIYLFTTDGNIIKMDFNLKKIKTLKLPYAHFIAPAFYGDRIVFGENSVFTYLFTISKNLDDIRYYYLNISFEADSKILGGVFYYKNEYLNLKGVIE